MEGGRGRYKGGRTHVFVVVAFFLTSAEALAQPIKLEYRFQLGDSAKYRTSETITETGERISLGGKHVHENSSDVLVRVEAVYSDSSADVSATTLSHTHKLNGQEHEHGSNEEGQLIHIPRTKPSGKILDYKLRPLGNLHRNVEKDLEFHKNHLQAPLHKNPIFPEKPLAIGESWTNENIESFESGADFSVNIKYTLEKFEVINGVECAKIKISGKLAAIGNEGQSTMEGTLTGTWHFGHKVGRDVRLVTDIKRDVVATTPEGVFSTRIREQVVQERVIDR